MLKSEKGRLLPEGVVRVFKLREEKNPKTGKRWTYQQLAQEMGVSVSTIYNVLTEKTHRGEAFHTDE
jgi:transcriptional regulator with XRE-family HTH domain